MPEDRVLSADTLIEEKIRHETSRQCSAVQQVKPYVLGGYFYLGEGHPKFAANLGPSPAFRPEIKVCANVGLSLPTDLPSLLQPKGLQESRETADGPRRR